MYQQYDSEAVCLGLGLASDKSPYGLMDLFAVRPLFNVTREVMMMESFVGAICWKGQNVIVCNSWSKNIRVVRG